MFHNKKGSANQLQKKGQVLKCFITSNVWFVLMFSTRMERIGCVRAEQQTERKKLNINQTSEHVYIL